MVAAAGNLGEPKPCSTGCSAGTTRNASWALVAPRRVRAGPSARGLRPVSLRKSLDDTHSTRLHHVSHESEVPGHGTAADRLTDKQMEHGPKNGFGAASILVRLVSTPCLRNLLIARVALLLLWFSAAQPRTARPPRGAAPARRPRPPRPAPPQARPHLPAAPRSGRAPPPPRVRGSPAAAFSCCTCARHTAATA